MVGAKWLFLIYFGYRAVGYHSPENFPFASIFGVAGKMSGSGATYYDEELKYLYRLLKNLPDVIPEGNPHGFTNYVPDPQKTKDFGCTKSVVSQVLKSSFGWRDGQRGVRVGLGREKNGQILLSRIRRPKKLYFSSLGLKTGL
ncbi:hypothetical protein DFH08DRAFT_801624 [Mycena albidolilacea]|uniref:Uncharacterized protein n=1 Tax=Mycena albidolilacea TaxID=1033008 RepID=A0AAD7F0J6_9AGAR|nr:hypothetical protein DFH08DRAFT_801624 [Mycena albidolilacea]